MGCRKFAVLLCAEDPEYIKRRYGGYYGVFKKMLGEKDETWDVFHVVRREFPDDDEIEGYDGFVITGSCSDAHGDDLWICELIDLLKKINLMKKKVLGICFGHQVLSLAIGGKIGRAESWDIGLRTIQLSTTKSNLNLSSLKIPTKLSLIKAHRDEVKELPPKAVILAKSEITGIEMFVYGDHMMGIQGHPEYTKDILLYLIDHALLRRNFITESYADEVRANIGECEPDKEAWRRLCMNFLKSRL